MHSTTTSTSTSISSKYVAHTSFAAVGLEDLFKVLLGKSRLAAQPFYLLVFLELGPFVHWGVEFNKFGNHHCSEFQ
jgi:hypothetical protein